MTAAVVSLVVCVITVVLSEVCKDSSVVETSGTEDPVSVTVSD